MNGFVGQVQNLLEVNPPADEPITLAQAKAHLKVDFTDDDDLIAALITAAREKAEAETKRAFVSRDYLLQLNGFPYMSSFGAAQALNAERLPNLCFGKIQVPKPPLISVASISYIDNNGATQTLDPSAYLVMAGGKLQGVITPAYGTVWPVARYQLGSVQIAYTAGYGAVEDVPVSIGRAMLLMLTHWYRNRADTAGTGLAEIPMGSKALLSPFEWGSYG